MWTSSGYVTDAKADSGVGYETKRIGGSALTADVGLWRELPFRPWALNGAIWSLVIAEASRFPFTTRDNRRKSLRGQDKYEITAALGRRLNVRATFDDICSTRRDHPLVAWCFHALLTGNNIEGFRARMGMNACSHPGWKDGLGEMRRGRAGRHSKRTDAGPLDAAPHILELIANDVQPHP